MGGQNRSDEAIGQQKNAARSFRAAKYASASGTDMHRSGAGHDSIDPGRQGGSHDRRVVE